MEQPKKRKFVTLSAVALAVGCCWAYDSPSPTTVSKAPPVMQNQEFPKPYTFGYNVNDGYNNRHHHNEGSDAQGSKTGSYGYSNTEGIYRKVKYIADNQGFRAEIVSNEPGLGAPSSADVLLRVNPFSSAVQAQTESLRAPVRQLIENSMVNAQLNHPLVEILHTPISQSMVRGPAVQHIVKKVRVGVKPTYHTTVHVARAPATISLSAQAVRSPVAQPTIKVSTLAKPIQEVAHVHLNLPVWQVLQAPVSKIQVERIHQYAQPEIIRALVNKSHVVQKLTPIKQIKVIRTSFSVPQVKTVTFSQPTMSFPAPVQSFKSHVPVPSSAVKTY